MKCSFSLLFTCVLLLYLWRAAEVAGDVITGIIPAGEVSAASKCTNCHGDVKMDTSHDFSCSVCHGGQDQEEQAEKAHQGLIAGPAHPEQGAKVCGKCHPRQTAEAADDPHYTLVRKINAARAHFGAQETLTTPQEIPEHTAIETPLALADDMLRRRCLRCHVYSSGDAYSSVRHGTGCSACHLSFYNGKLQSHVFAKPADTQCLSCHYGNHVGNDYYGRYEHDYNLEYRTPFSPQGYPPRPYGVENHDLSPDIHQQRGLICIDCHQKTGHREKSALRCSTCHEWNPGNSPLPLENLEVRDKTLVLTSRATGKSFPIPLLQHPAHQQYGKTVACQVCHAQWSFNDSTTHLLLSMTNDYEPWERLTVQGSSEVEARLEDSLYGSSAESLPTMRDGLSGQSRPGIWYQGFTQRRWEQMIIDKDTDGIIKVFRPILDLRLTLVDEDGTVRFDNITGNQSGLRPYTPHTTGHAGLFYRDRFKHLLAP